MVERQTFGIRTRRTIRALLAHGFLLAGSVLMLMPLYWMITTSLKTPAQAVKYPPEWIPTSLTLDAYEQIFDFYRWDIFLRNTLFITLLVLIGTCLSSMVVAFGFAFFRFRAERSLIFGHISKVTPHIWG